MSRTTLGKEQTDFLFIRPSWLYFSFMVVLGLSGCSGLDGVESSDNSADAVSLLSNSIGIIQRNCPKPEDIRGKIDEIGPTVQVQPRAFDASMPQPQAYQEATVAYSYKGSIKGYEDYTDIVELGLIGQSINHKVTWTEKVPPILLPVSLKSIVAISVPAGKTLEMKCNYCMDSQCTSNLEMTHTIGDIDDNTLLRNCRIVREDSMKLVEPKCSHGPYFNLCNTTCEGKDCIFICKALETE